MNTPTTITQILHARADEKLRRDIEKLMRPLHDFINTGEPHRFRAVADAPIEGKDDRYIMVYWREAHEAIKEMAFNLKQTKYRDAAVNDFMVKVEHLSEQIEELQNQVMQ